MLKKMLLVLIVGLAVTFTNIDKAEAVDVYVGTSPATGWQCYVMTETIERTDNGSYTRVVLKMLDNRGSNHLLRYGFWYDPQYDVMRFENYEGYSGVVNRYETPIEWEMLQVIRDY